MEVSRIGVYIVEVGEVSRVVGVIDFGFYFKIKVVKGILRNI